MTIEYTIHPAADVFPMLPEAELTALAEDIKANGLRDPIVRMGDVILDGRNRWEACRRANVIPQFREVQVADPVAYIVSANIHRRHLTTSQRAAIAAELATMKSGHRTDLGSNDPRCELPPVSIEQAAEMMGVGTASVKRAKKTMRENPEAHEAAKRGEKSPKPEAEKEEEDMTSRSQGDYWKATALAAYSQASGNKRSEKWIRDNLKPVLIAELDWFRNKDPRALLTEEEVADVYRVVARFADGEGSEKARAALEKEAEAAKTALSKTAQERLEHAISVHKRLAEREFDERVRQAVLKELDGDILPKYAQEYERYKRYVDTYKGVLTYSEYKMLKGFLHPDRHPENQDKAAALFRLISEKEDLLCGLKESEKADRPATLPRTVAELMARRRAH